MLSTTLPRLKCLCDGKLVVVGEKGPAAGVREISSGELKCDKCASVFLILGGVALLVEDTAGYLVNHVKGVAQMVPDSEIPKKYRRDFLEAKAELRTEHIEEDLEAERVNALYLMNHYLQAGPQANWWRPEGVEVGSPLIDELVRAHWDRGPLALISEWVGDFVRESGRFTAALELGCGVGGMHARLRSHCEFYLGVDSSFASIALARHLALGVPYSGRLKIPGDLLAGGVSREVEIPRASSMDGRVDFIVGDLQAPPVIEGWDLSLSLNTMDMLEDPADLPRQQHSLLRKGGVAIQSCPYIWHEEVAKELRSELPPVLRADSARAAEWLYEREGFQKIRSVDHLPWLFFKHLRQLEVYSVHVLAAKK